MIGPWAIGPRLRCRLRTLARSRVLLVMCDYDGTLAPIVDDPSEAWPDREAMEALSELGRLPDTHAAVMSGRDLVELRRLTGAPEAVTLIGGHGAESGGVPAIEPDQRRRLDEVAARFHALADSHPGSIVEEKPASVAFHYRRVDAADRGRVADEATGLADEFPQLRMMAGKCLVEFLGGRVHKGTALASLTERLEASRVVFLGDDVTDEDGFAALRARDVGVKVGRGPTLAGYRVRDVAAATSTLGRLHRLRRRRSERIHP